MILQLNPQISLLTPKGKAEAIFLIDYSKEEHLMFVCIIQESGEIWTFPSHQCRGTENITLGRVYADRAKHGITGNKLFDKPNR